MTIRGPFSQPQVAGRLELKDAYLKSGGIPVVVSNTNGVILFDGSRATIQRFVGRERRRHRASLGIRGIRAATR